MVDFKQLREFRRKVLKQPDTKFVGYQDPVQAKLWLRLWVECFSDVFQNTLVHRTTNYEFMRIRILMEEALEGCSIRNDNFPQVVQGMMEMAYLSLLMLDRFGVPIEEVWEEIQKEAMLQHQVAGVANSRGEIVRAPNREVREIENILKQRNKQ